MTTIALPMFAMIAAIILLIIIGLILWHKKAASQEYSLQSIEERLIKIEKDLRNYADDMKKQEAFAVPAPETPPLSQENELDLQDLQEEELLVDIPEENEASETEVREEVPSAENLIQEQDANLDRGSEQPTSIYNIGKSGKIYTEEELDLLIKE